MAAVQYVSTSRLTLQSSPPSQSLGIYLSGVKKYTIGNLGYTVTDPTGNLYVATVNLYGRITVLLGNQNPPTFQLAGIGPNNLPPQAFGVCLLDVVYTGFSGIISFAAGEALENDEGEGITILMSQPTVVGPTGSTPVVSLFGINGNAPTGRTNAAAPGSSTRGSTSGGAAGGGGYNARGGGSRGM